MTPAIQRDEVVHLRKEFVLAQTPNVAPSLAVKLSILTKFLQKFLI